MSIERMKHIEMAKPAVPATEPAKRERILVPPRPGTIPEPIREKPIKEPVPAMPEREREKVPV